MNKFEFDGIPSGDGECFCWDVDKETYIRIRTQNYKDMGYSAEQIEEELQNDLKWDKAVFHKGMYMLHPNDVVGKSVKKHFVIESEEV